MATSEPFLAALAALHAATEPIYVRQILAATGRSAGTLHPILDRLIEDGWATRYWEDDPGRFGPRRRYYQLTELGRAEAGQLLAAHAAP